MMDNLEGLKSARTAHRVVTLSLKVLMKRLLVAALTASALLAGRASARAEFVSYDTTGAWNGSNSISSFGAGTSNTATYGETFVAPSGGGSLLKDFSFPIKPSLGVHLQMHAYVYAWTGPLMGHGGRATGSALYTSPTVILDGNGSFQTVTFGPTADVLLPGQNYVAFLTVSNPDDYAKYQATGVSSATFFGLVATPHPAGNGGGGFVYANNTSDFASLTSSTWTTVSDRGDLAWTAEFEVVPEPGTLMLSAFAAGTLGLVALCRRRRD